MAVPALYLVTMATMLLNLATAQTSKVYRTRPTQDTCYCLREFIGNLRNPLSIIFYKEKQEEQVLVLEQRGLVSRYAGDGSGGGAVFLNLTSRVQTSDNQGETRGLLSLVLHPFFESTRNVYVYYIRHDGNKDYAYVSRFRAASGAVDLSTETYLLRLYQPHTDGNGGPMLFGDDGCMYIVTGDGGDEEDPLGNAQNKKSFHGKVLRIDVNGRQDFTSGEVEVAKNYAVPEDNPFVNMSSSRPEIYALGIRNMWGCSLDSVRFLAGSGRIFCAETGTNKLDEIDIIEKGRNYGWNIKEGTLCRNASTCPIDDEGLPIYQFAHQASHALVGGYVYRGKHFDWLKGYYTFGDVVTGKTYLLRENRTGHWERQDWLPCPTDQCPSSAKDQGLNYILGFGQDPSGELYILMTDLLSVDVPAGKIFKLTAPGSATVQRSPSIHLVITCTAILMSLRQFL